MFYNCSSLKSLDISNLNTSNVTDMSGMFLLCSSLKSLDLSNFKTSSFTDMSGMFLLCSSLKSLDLSNFKTSSVTDMSGMFLLCSLLKSLDLSNFNTKSVKRMIVMFSLYFTEEFYWDYDYLDLEKFLYNNSLISLSLRNFETSSVEDMSYMFYYCNLLTSLDITNFDTYLVTDMALIFAGCSSLVTLDLRNFITRLVTNMNLMFGRCSSLISLDLNNFDIMFCQTTIGMFYNCKNLKFINLKNFYQMNQNNESFYEMFGGTSDFLVYCINKRAKDTDQIKFQLLSKNCSVEYCSDDWQSKVKKVLNGKEKCLEDCSTILNYEYNGICYPKCPEGTNISKYNEYLCENISNIAQDISSPKSTDIIITTINEITEYHNSPEIVITTPNEIAEYSSVTEYKSIINDIIMDIKEASMDSILNNIIGNNKTDYIQSYGDIIIQITTLENQKNNKYDNISSLNIDKQCEIILKKTYNISQNETLILIKSYNYTSGINIPFIRYDIIHPITKEILDLKYHQNNLLN